MNCTSSICSLILGIFLVITASFPVYSAESKSVPLQGQIGASPVWGSGWLDLASDRDFAKGDVLQLEIGGTAQKVLVRLLQKGQSPDSTDGIIGVGVAVPKDRIINIRLSSPYKSIVQISVHGGSNPWGRYSLGGSNGPATLESVKLIRK